MDDDKALAQAHAADTGRRSALAARLRSKRVLVALAAALAAAVVIGLAVGLGVGLTRGSDDNTDAGSDAGTGTGPNRTAVWRPAVAASWQIVLSKPIDLGDARAVTPAVDVYDLDLFDNDADTFAKLHAAGVKVICYFSAGSYENWRPDKDRFADADMGNELDGWPGEKWLNLSSPGVRAVIKDRIKLAASKGCDAIDPDNVDGYQNDNGLGLTPAMAVDFVKFLSDEAAAYNMSTGLKNAADIIDDVLDSVSFSVNEQCIQYGECKSFAAFIAARKPVFNIEYPKDAGEGLAIQVADDICSHRDKAANTDGFSTVIKKMKLDGFVEYCGGNKFTTPINS